MNPEIAALRALFTAKPRPTDWPERRQRMDEICAVDPPPADVVYTPAAVGAIPAEWSLAPGADATRVLLYLHGGGYCSGSIASHRGLVGRIGREAGIRTLALGYRLAPENPCPAALLDALAAYGFLRSEGYEPEQIVVGGDSAGGGLTLATLLALREEGSPMPAGAWLVSPWVDLAMTGASMEEEDAIDPLIHGDYLRGLAGAYLGGRDARDERASPLYADLAGMPPTLVQVGSSETLLDDAVRVTRRLGAAAARVDLEIWPEMIHAWMLWAPRLEAGRAASTTASAFLRARLKPGKP